MKIHVFIVIMMDLNYIYILRLFLLIIVYFNDLWINIFGGTQHSNILLLKTLINNQIGILQVIQIKIYFTILQCKSYI